jgi:hypothetical protein
MKIARLIVISCAFSCVLLTPAFSENTCNDSMKGKSKLGVVWNTPNGVCVTQWTVICRQSWTGAWNYYEQVGLARGKSYVYQAQYQDRWMDECAQIPTNPDPCRVRTPDLCVQICPDGPGCPRARGRRG